MDHSPNLLPPPPPPSSQFNMPMFYYGLVVVGTTGILVVLYNLIVIIVRLCMGHQYHRGQSQRTRPPRLTSRTLVSGSSRSLDNPNIRLMSSFKYKKSQGQVGQDHQHEDYELQCPVCLSVVEEGEEVRQLPRCKHSFHVPCIDMWLYSHFNCPVCRAPVEQPVPRPHAAVDPSEITPVDGFIIIDTSNLA